MKYVITFSSMSGNTAALVGRLHDLLPAESCVYFGDHSQEVAQLDADLFFVGFWTDRGSCDDKTRVFLKKLDGKTIVLFGTAGFGLGDDYFRQILDTAARDIPVSNTVVPGFMCQGKVGARSRAHFEALLAREPENDTYKKVLEACRAAESHPDDADFKRLDEWISHFDVT